MDELKEDLDILSFFTRVQKNVCEKAKYECTQTNVGQTPQLQIFASASIQVCAKHSLGLNEK